jgi:LDH2 family malate/lactate/ureidoglycolate dehydrogenase
MMVKDEARANVVRVESDRMRQFGVSLFEAAGVNERDARIVTGHVIEASEMHVHSHGLVRIPQYINDIEKGAIDPKAEPIIVYPQPAVMEVDGGYGLGQVVGHRMVDLVSARAKEYGIAIARGRHLGHTGRIGAYTEALAQRGLIGMGFCNGPPNAYWVAPFGGKEGRLATNPIAFAWPVEGQDPVSADFSTSVTPEGVLRVLRNKGLLAPRGTLRDAEGNETQDPNVLYRTPSGTIQPFGGTLGYRGTAFAMLVEILTTILNGDEMDDLSRRGSDLTLVAVNTRPTFNALARRLSDHVRGASPIEPSRPVRLPGSLEREAQSRATDVSVDIQTWKALTDIADRYHLSEPKAVA